MVLRIEPESAMCQSWYLLDCHGRSIFLGDTPAVRPSACHSGLCFCFQKQKLRRRAHPGPLWSLRLPQNTPTPRNPSLPRSLPLGRRRPPCHTQVMARPTLVHIIEINTEVTENRIILAKRKHRRAGKAAQWLGFMPTMHPT